MKTRVYISPDGDINLFDPNLSIETFIKALKPDFEASSFYLKDYVPFLQRTKNLSIGIPQSELERLSPEELKEIHDKVLLNQNSNLIKTGATLLDLKIEMAKRELENCQLCGNNCRVNRFLHKGKCNLVVEAYCASVYVHLGEEPIINPSLAINLDFYGCGLDCVFCQSKGIAEANSQELMPLSEALWQKILPDMDKAATIEFAGGSPDENIYGILKFLKKAPQQILPIVSNCHLYANEIVYRLWDGIIDFYVADFKFGNDRCARELAGIDSYVDKALKGLKAILSRFDKPKVIIRLLVLPSHVECCSIKTLEMLLPFKEEILLNVMDQYVPEYKILKGFQPELNRRAHSDEIVTVLSEAKRLGFRLI